MRQTLGADSSTTETTSVAANDTPNSGPQLSSASPIRVQKLKSQLGLQWYPQSDGAT